MSKLFLLITSAMLGIAGCASHSHMLGQGSAPELLNGELNHIQPSRLVLESKERKYVAEGFEVLRHRNLAELSKRYRMTNPKHWDRIFAGHDTEHENYSAEVKLKAPDNSELNCRLAWLSVKNPSGVCYVKDGKEYIVRFD